MITIAFANRDRDLKIIEKCFNSLKCQSVKTFEVILVDYGSESMYLDKLKIVVANFSFVKLIECETYGQLWNKSRALNIALKNTITPYFLVADIDLIFHPNSIQKTHELARSDGFTYFQTGFLSKEESSCEKTYEMYEVAFKSNEEATGITLFSLQSLQEINGYDEFYHGWGGEDTDVHIRMKNAGLKVLFYNQEVLVKHQWHPKVYRSKESQHPFHSQLERINQIYMQQSFKSKRTSVNNRFNFGKEPVSSEYEKLHKKADYNFHINNSQIALDAILAQMNNFSSETILITITKVSISAQLKSRIKRLLGKKYIPYLLMESVNNSVLLEIIYNYRNNPYHYTFDRQRNIITLIIRF